MEQNNMAKEMEPLQNDRLKEVIKTYMKIIMKILKKNF